MIDTIYNVTETYPEEFYSVPPNLLIDDSEKKKTEKNDFLKKSDFAKISLVKKPVYVRPKINRRSSTRGR